MFNPSENNSSPTSATARVGNWTSHQERNQNKTSAFYGSARQEAQVRSQYAYEKRQQHGQTGMNCWVTGSARMGAPGDKGSTTIAPFYCARPSKPNSSRAPRMPRTTRARKFYISNQPDVPNSAQTPELFQINSEFAIQVSKKWKSIRHACVAVDTATPPSGCIDILSLKNILRRFGIAASFAQLGKFPVKVVKRSNKNLPLKTVYRGIPYNALVRHCLKQVELGR